MSIAISLVPSVCDVGAADPVVGKPFSPPRPLHRLRAARRSEGISRRTVARRLGISAGKVHEQEQESADLTLSTLYAWQEVLNVPISELLVETEESLSAPVMRRAQLLRVMKTVQTILERSRQVSIRRLAQTLADQLAEIMPELKQVGPWPAVGKRRTSRELGQAAYRRLCADMFAGSED